MVIICLLSHTILNPLNLYPTTGYQLTLSHTNCYPLFFASLTIGNPLTLPHTINFVYFQEQFQFALAAVAEEVHAILKALPQ